MCWGMTDSIIIITIMHLLESSVLKEDPTCSYYKCFRMANTSHDVLWEIGFKCKDLARILRLQKLQKRLESTPLGYSAKA